jgi:4'-phosphopantetheinyl transferase
MNLGKNDLHIWHIPLGGESLLQQSFPPLPSEAEITQAAKFTHPLLHQCYLKTRWAMRKILGRYLSEAPEKVQLRYAELGKPELIPGAHSLDIRFNLTHSGNGALFAVTLGTEVGIDMEKIGHKPRPLRLASRYFTKDVVQQLDNLNGQDQQLGLLKLWTQYEAYKKAQGLGLRGGDDLLPLNLHLTADKFQPFPSPSDQVPAWLVAQLQPAPGYVGAIVIEANDDRYQMSHIDYEAYSF